MIVAAVIIPTPRIVVRIAPGVDERVSSISSVKKWILSSR